MKKPGSLLIIGIICGLCFGCAKQYNVDVNGIIAQPPVTLQANCVILPASPQISAEDLLFQEFSVYVANALNKQGYNVVRGHANAPTGILLGYGVGDPAEKISAGAYPSIGFGGYYGGWGHHGWGWGFGPSIYFPLGYDADSYTTWGSHLYLAAYDLQLYRQTGQLVYAWQVIVNVRSTNNDIRDMVPVMVAAAEPYIGRNTGRQVTVTISADDPYLKELETLVPHSTVNAKRTDYTTAR